jgi:hypothetical protein
MEELQISKQIFRISGLYINMKISIPREGDSYRPTERNFNRTTRTDINLSARVNIDNLAARAREIHSLARV